MAGDWKFIYGCFCEFYSTFWFTKTNSDEFLGAKTGIIWCIIKVAQWGKIAVQMSTMTHDLLEGEALAFFYAVLQKTVLTELFKL